MTPNKDNEDYRHFELLLVKSEDRLGAGFASSAVKCRYFLTVFADVLTPNHFTK